ncbi:MAG: glutamyl-tRNA reductase [Candidatus Omnitrophota bacterium]
MFELYNKEERKISNGVSIVVIGTNHKFSPIELRERISFSKRRMGQTLSLLKERPVFKGAVILSTCNRVELYASAENPGAGITELLNFLCRFHEIDRKRIFPYLYIYQGDEAIRHLFSVACGLDSLILGETQVLGQLKSAFIEARNAGFADKYLNTAFNGAIVYAKKIHRETAISEGKVSIGSLAIDFIKEKINGLSGKNILIIGAGKVTELVLKYLEDEKPKVVFISNRDFKKAEELAAQIGQRAVRFDGLPQLLKQADVIISATASPHFIIKKETLRHAISRKLLIVDLAMPRDVDPKVREIENVELFNLEDFSFVVQKNLEKKRLEAERIEKLIDQEAALLWQKLTVSEPEPALLP